MSAEFEGVLAWSEIGSVLDGLLYAAAPPPHGGSDTRT